VALIGPPTSGVYLAKTLLLKAADDTHQWWWATVLEMGGVLTSGYLVLVIAQALAPAGKGPTSRNAISHHQEAAALTLVVCSLLLGLLPWQAWLPLPVPVTAPDPFGFGALWSLLWPLLLGVALAALLGRWGNHRPPRVAQWLERADGALRQWPAAGFSLLGVTILLGLAMLTALR
jgi:cobalamin synthase